MPRDRDEDERDDDKDEEEEDRPVKKKRSSGGGVSAVIPYKNGMALASYYLGIFGLIPCIFGLGVLGIVPLILGVLGMIKAKQNPEAHGTAHAIVGILCGLVEMLSGCGAIGYVIFAGIPKF